MKDDQGIQSLKIRYWYIINKFGKNLNTIFKIYHTHTYIYTRRRKKLKFYQKFNILIKMSL